MPSALIIYWIFLNNPNSLSALIYFQKDVFFVENHTFLSLDSGIWYLLRHTKKCINFDTKLVTIFPFSFGLIFFTNSFKCFNSEDIMAPLLVSQELFNSFNFITNICTAPCTGWCTICCCFFFYFLQNFIILLVVI